VLGTTATWLRPANILAEGLRVAAGHADTRNACGDRVRLPMGAAVGEAGTRIK
jgi:hypothetical protein